jgi:hypothetical protein
MFLFQNIIDTISLWLGINFPLRVLMKRMCVELLLWDDPFHDILTKGGRSKSIGVVQMEQKTLVRCYMQLHGVQQKLSAIKN